ncbi:single-stranded DNA-binding protein [Acidithiobacillus thiooxidans]|uniref:single-stranded DNA-binding protein n=1 Tax=Acidithiobacillus thiooxidans TaxID=930 RepID=UPI0035632252
MSINQVSLLGHVGQDPDLRRTTSGANVANIRIATSQIYKDQAGNRNEHTEWHQVTAWGRLAEVIGEYVHKGDQIHVSGFLHTQRWTNAQGVERFSIKVVAKRLELLGGRKGKDIPDHFDPEPAIEDMED